MGPITASEGGFRYIFVATCDLTKYSIAIPTIDHTAATIADCFLKHVILNYGFPELVTSDNGPEFANEVFKELNKLLKIKQIYSTPYHPNSNIVERQNRNTNKYLRAYVAEKPQTWAQFLPYAMFAYNITIHATTGYSPFFLLYGREVTLPDAILRKIPIYNYDNFAKILVRELHDAWNIAEKNIMKAKKKNKVNMINK